jgi:hypothetical protein
LFFIDGADDMNTHSLTVHTLCATRGVESNDASTAHANRAASKTTRSIEACIDAIRPFLSRVQCTVLQANCYDCDEGEYFQNLIRSLATRIEGMPVTYDQEGQGDEAIAYLHYFRGGSDWYITEKDVDGGIDQAFGFVVLNGDKANAEFGYISIAELAENGIELDLHFSPVPIRSVKAKR